MNTSCWLVWFGLLMVCTVQAQAAVPDSHGYIGIRSLQINLSDGYADAHVEYEIDEAFRVIMLVFGENDAKDKLRELLAFENATITGMSFSSADLRIFDVKQVYGDGLYWFPAHSFNTVIPNLTICSNQGCTGWNNVTSLDEGIAYY